MVALWYLLIELLLISKLYYIAAELVIGYLSSGCYHMGREGGDLGVWEGNLAAIGQGCCLI